MSIINAPSIVATSASFPGTYYSQEVLAEVICDFLQAEALRFDPEVVRTLFENVQIDGRYFAFSVDDFAAPPPTSQIGERAIETCVSQAEHNVRQVLAQSRLTPSDISQIVSVTLTPAVPSVEARLMNRVAFRRDLKRMPLAGLGCMAGAAAISRAADYLRNHPRDALILISCELSSGLWQGSIQNDLTNLIHALDRNPAVHAEIIMALVTAALFGDGSGAVLMVGGEHPLAGTDGAVRVLDHRSNWIPDTEHIMGLDLVDFGFRNILRPEVKSYVGVGLREVILPMLSRAGVDLRDIDHWLIHPGGPRIMDAAELEFGLPSDKMKPCRDALRKVGNVSSATILYMLDEASRNARPPAGTTGVLVAMGPGFSQEAVLLGW